MACTFKLPEDVQVPDGKEMGDTFQAMGTFLLKANGMVTLTEVDGEPIPGAPKTGDEPEETDNAADQAPPMSLQQRLMSSVSNVGQ